MCFICSRENVSEERIITLECKHSLCLDCLFAICQATGEYRYDRIISCPYCRQRIQTHNLGIDPIHMYNKLVKEKSDLNNFVDKIQAILYFVPKKQPHIFLFFLKVLK